MFAGFRSTGSSLGVAFAVVVGFSFCMSCCIACCKQQKNERQNVTVSNVQPIVAYSSGESNSLNIGKNMHLHYEIDDK